MNASRMKEEPRDRVEIVLRTDANLSSPERVKCEAKIRAILNKDEIEVSDLTFQEGSTIITIGVLVGTGLAYCFAQYFAGALQYFGKVSVDRLLPRLRATSTNDDQMAPVPVGPIKNITSELPEVGPLGTGWPKDAVALLMSAESAGQALAAFAYNLPGVEKSIKVVAVTFDNETQERVEEIYQRKISKR